MKPGRPSKNPNFNIYILKKLNGGLKSMDNMPVLSPFLKFSLDEMDVKLLIVLR